jgi:hypothetical protein
MASRSIFVLTWRVVKQSAAGADLKGFGKATGPRAPSRDVLKFEDFRGYTGPKLGGLCRSSLTLFSEVWAAALQETSRGINSSSEVPQAEFSIFQTAPPRGPRPWRRALPRASEMTEAVAQPIGAAYCGCQPGTRTGQTGSPGSP